MARVAPKISNSKALPKGPKLPATPKSPAVKFNTPKQSNPKMVRPSVSKGLLGYLAGTQYSS